MRNGVRLSKPEARRRGFATGRRIAKRVDFSPITDVMAERCLRDQRSSLRLFETKELVRVSPVRAEVLSLAFYEGLVSGISHTIRERRKTA